MSSPTPHASTPAPPPTASPAPGDGIIRVGIIVTAIGILITLVAMLPLVTPIELPSAFWGLSMITGIGLLLILLGLLRAARGRGRAIRSAVGEPPAGA